MLKDVGAEVSVLQKRKQNIGFDELCVGSQSANLLAYGQWEKWKLLCPG